MSELYDLPLDPKPPGRLELQLTSERARYAFFYSYITCVQVFLSIKNIN